MSLLPAPNMNAKPKAQNRMPQSAVSTMHSRRMLLTSRVRAKPASSIMNPACMKKTRKAATSTQTVFSELTTSSGAGASEVLCALATEWKKGASTFSATSRSTTPSILPTRYTAKKRRDSFSRARSFSLRSKCTPLGDGTASAGPNGTGIREPGVGRWQRTKTACRHHEVAVTTRSAASCSFLSSAGCGHWRLMATRRRSSAVMRWSWSSRPDLELDPRDGAGEVRVGRVVVGHR